MVGVVPSTPPPSEAYNPSSLALACLSNTARMATLAHLLTPIAHLPYVVHAHNADMHAHLGLAYL